MDAAQWKAWLARSVPASVFSTEVTIEGAFQGSDLLLSSIPTEIWTMMPANDPSYTFVGHVTSSNLLLQQPSRLFSHFRGAVNGDKAGIEGNR
ncbi:hypothetical protein N7539_009096 [Penicillium diatomitis]|uniref:Uncharacterized protein n=1 Tax=Penicillium diatomitis TaxID=2819901 RepID=A0A9X0BJL8_9EURO|nr:uncharacterized protein N7539_009096 [Penicillium diatomitis]KAJ5469478.1 hypothetical protein N7539_009096 [Penicillium diatomitis]